MSFSEINLFGVYVALISLILVAPCVGTIALRRIAHHSGLLRHVWHPPLFLGAVYMIVSPRWFSPSHAESAVAQVEVKSPPQITKADREIAWPPDPIAHAMPRPRRPILTLLITFGAVALAVGLGSATWDAYMGGPWIRDGTVRVHVVTMALEVAGRIVKLPVADSQFVHKGDLIMVIEPTNIAIAVHQAGAAVEQAKVVAENVKVQATRQQKLTALSVSTEEKQNFASSALSAKAAYDQSVTNLDQARVNLERTRIVSPVNGYVTNLLAQLGDYVNVGEKSISVVNADFFWGYFEKTNLERIREGDPATVKLMGYRQIVRGHVDSVARGINVSNAQPDQAGLASVNTIFTWVRLAQRVPVRIHIDQVPGGVRLVQGMTATVQIGTMEAGKTL